MVCPSVCEAREYCLDGKCECNPKIANQFDKCCGIELLTNVPFIGKCITLVSKAKQDKMPGVVDKDTLIVSEEEAFPRLML
ncbi:hypothetical protein KKG31_00585 [Patescibacteria group bacterium]|nr:hypothetical protein [Patescibacteria group bacterium]MBU1757682.1 hypothetical protein [Patescibacteria group bacterium]